jgi:ATP synthase (C/AC39) subunit
MKQSALRSETWTYASGRVAALEGQLLTAEALERLAAADSPAAVGAALSDSPLRAALAEAHTPAGAAAAIAAYYTAAVASLENDCPFPEMFELVAMPSRFGALKERVRLALSESTNAEVSADDLPELLGGFDANSEAARGLGLLLSVLAQADPPETELALNLTLDSARLLESLRLAGSLGDEDVLEHVRDEVAVRSVLVLWRSRIVAGADADAPALALLPRLYLRGALAGASPARLLKLPLAQWRRVLGDELTRSLGGETFGDGEESRLNAWEKRAFDWLTSRARELRGQAFGVGRVYGYAWGLTVEQRNVRLAMVGRLRGVSAEAIEALLWESYV